MKRKFKLCEYCGARAYLVDSSAVYRRSYGLIYHCPPCNAWVGVHKGTTRALGRLANAELRRWKIKAHDAFDPICKFKSKRRDRAYQWLAKQLGLTRNQCHIGKFDVEQCRLVVEVCNEYRKNGAKNEAA